MVNYLCNQDCIDYTNKSLYLKLLKQSGNIIHVQQALIVQLQHVQHADGRDLYIALTIRKNKILQQKTK